MAEQGLGHEDASLGVYWMAQNSGDDGLMEVADPGGAIDDAENLLNRTMERIRTGDFAVVDVPHGQEVWNVRTAPVLPKPIDRGCAQLVTVQSW